MENDSISRQAAIRWVKTECNPCGKPTLDFESGKRVIEHLKQMPSAQPEIVRCGECVYRRSCMLQHFAESNAVDGTKIDWSDWYCAEGVRDINNLTRGGENEQYS